MDPEIVLSVKNLGKKYGELAAVDGVTFDVHRDEIVGLLGPNGAGKTTTINMILGVLEPGSGTIAIEGIDLMKRRSEALTFTNFAAVYAPPPGNLTVEQNLRFFGLLYGPAGVLSQGVKDGGRSHVPWNLPMRIEEMLAQFDLAGLRAQKCGVLSSGEQTRVSLAKAMLNNPRLLLLDEPTASLDPATAREARARIREIAGEEETGILWTSHNMIEVEEVCDRVLFLSRGKILLEGDPKSLPGEYGKSSLEELFITVAREPLTLEN